jgi:hypothetical protein
MAGPRATRRGAVSCIGTPWTMRIDYNDRLFRAVSNSPGGEVDETTLFDYRQHGDVVWVTYQGGLIALGTMVGVVRGDGSLDLRYQHVTTSGEIRTGRCLSVPELLEDGRVRLRESWQWTEGGTGGGTSLVEQVAVRQAATGGPSNP